MNGERDRIGDNISYQRSTDVTVPLKFTRPYRSSLSSTSRSITKLSLSGEALQTYYQLLIGFPLRSAKSYWPVNNHGRVKFRQTLSLTKVGHFSYR